VALWLLVAASPVHAALLRISPPAAPQSQESSSSPRQPLLAIASPNVSVTLPSLNLPLPKLGISLPSVTVSVPSIGVSLPGVSVATPSVSVTTPSITTTAPSSSEGSKPETPVEESPSQSPPAGSAPASPGQQESERKNEHVTYAPVAGTTTPGVSTAATKAPAPTGGSSDTAVEPAARAREAGPARHATRRRGARRRTTETARAASAAGGGDAPTVAPSRPSPRAHPAVRSPRAASGPLETIGKQIPLPIPVPDWSKPIILLLALLAIWFAVRARAQSRRARRLERQRASLLRDVGAMQAALVPEIPARVGGVAVSVGYRPADGPAAGGDFYDVFVPERGKVAVILGDVAGHGHVALTQAALTRYTLRAYVQAGMEPRAALALTSRVLARPSAEQFATVVVGVYNTRDGTLTYASAGHPPPILHGLRTREPVKVCASPPVGWTVPTGRRQTTVSLPAGAIACFFSDGLVEARCEEDLLGRDRLSDMLGELGSRPNAGKLLARVRGAAAATPDDMAVCILVPELAIVGAGVHVEELEVDAATLEVGQARRFLETCQMPSVELERALYRAEDTVADRGTALLRVALSSTSATAEVTVPTLPDASIADLSAHPVGTR
jgi:hypothetical protein